MLLRRPHTEAIDWWALGILMCECLTGYHPFQGHSHHVLALQQGMGNNDE